MKYYFSLAGYTLLQAPASTTCRWPRSPRGEQSTFPSPHTRPHFISLPPSLCKPVADGEPEPAGVHARHFIYILFLPDYTRLEIEQRFLPSVFTSPVY